MSDAAIRQLIERLDEEQEGDIFADAAELPADLAQLAMHGGLPSSAQITTLLGSRRLRSLLREALPQGRTVPGEEEAGNAELTPLRWAAASRAEPELPWQHDIRVGLGPNAPVAAQLTVRRAGPGLYLTLRLDPSAWCGEVAGLRLCLREPETGSKALGLVWLEGETDAEGEISARWPEVAGTMPWTRLGALRKRRLDLSFSPGP